MKNMLRALLALVAISMAGAAFGQSQPNLSNIPPNSLVGRLGNGQSGPASAIPMSNTSLVSGFGLAYPGPAAAVTGATSAAKWIFGETADARTALTNEGGIWPGNKTFIGYGFSKIFTSANNSPTGYPPIANGPNPTIFSYAQNSGTNNDVTAMILDTNCAASNTACFGMNPIARSNGGGLTNVKLVGMEIDVEPAVGDSVASSSAGLYINAFSTAIPVAIQTGALGGGSFTNGITLNNITACGVCPGGNSSGMTWLMNTQNGSYSGLGAIFMANQHKLAFGNVGNASASTISNDSSGNIRITAPAGGFISGRNAADTANLWSFDNTGRLYLGENTTSQGQLVIKGVTSGAVTVQPQAAAGTYNFNLPTTAGSSGQALLSGGGGSTPMSFGTLANAGLADMAANTIKGNNTGGAAAPSDLTVAQVQALTAQSFLRTYAAAIDFNTVADTALTVPLPTGFTRFKVQNIFIYGASASLTTATVGVFPTTAGAGLAITTGGTAVTVSSASDAASNNLQALTVNATNVSYVAASLVTPNTIYFRVTNPQGSAATGNVVIEYAPLP